MTCSNDNESFPLPQNFLTSIQKKVAKNIAIVARIETHSLEKTNTLGLGRTNSAEVPGSKTSHFNYKSHKTALHFFCICQIFRGTTQRWTFIKVCLYRYIHAYNLLEAANLGFEYIHPVSQKLVLPTVPWFGTLGPAFHPFLEPQAPGALTTER